MDDKRYEMWYQDDQFENQFSTEYQKEHIEMIWSTFKTIIINHGFKNAKKIKVLDFGCGDGINIFGIKKILDSLGYSYEIMGVDFNDDRLKKVTNRFPEISVGKFDIVNDQLNEKYDLVIFNHVLEHIAQDDMAIKNLSGLLNDDGLVILGVPNEGCLIAKIRNHILHRKILKHTDHVQFYTLKKLLGKVESCFKVEGVFREDSIFMPHDRIYCELIKYRWGQKLLLFLSKIVPSQTSGLILGLTLLRRE